MRLPVSASRMLFLSRMARPLAPASRQMFRSGFAAPEGSRNFSRPPFSDHFHILLPGTSVKSR